MDLRYFQKGFNYSQDGPGNRLVYHLQGCNLRCPWCSNPEGLPLSGGQVCSVDEMAEEIARCRMLFFDGGGVTLTGGEISLQLDAVKALFLQLRDVGIDTAMETNGTSPRLAELFPVTDHLIMDCKHHSMEACASMVHGDCSMVFPNIRAAIAQKVCLAIRIPLIGGFNATEADAEKFCDLFDSLSVRGNATLELLRYHEFGRDKYERLGMPYTMTAGAFVGDAAYENIMCIFQDRGYPPIRT